MRAPSNEVADGTVLQEFRRGFKIGGQLLRPAMVQVWLVVNSNASIFLISLDVLPPRLRSRGPPWCRWGYRIKIKTIDARYDFCCGSKSCRSLHRAGAQHASWHLQQPSEGAAGSACYCSPHRNEHFANAWPTADSQALV